MRKEHDSKIGLFCNSVKYIMIPTLIFAMIVSSWTFVEPCQKYLLNIQSYLNYEVKETNKTMGDKAMSVSAGLPYHNLKQTHHVQRDR